MLRIASLCQKNTLLPSRSSTFLSSRSNQGSRSFCDVVSPIETKEEVPPVEAIPEAPKPKKVKKPKVIIPFSPLPSSPFFSANGNQKLEERREFYEESKAEYRRMVMEGVKKERAKATRKLEKRKDYIENEPVGVWTARKEGILQHDEEFQEDTEFFVDDEIDQNVMNQREAEAIEEIENYEMLRKIHPDIYPDLNKEPEDPKFLEEEARNQHRLEWDTKDFINLDITDVHREMKMAPMQLMATIREDMEKNGLILKNEDEMDLNATAHLVRHTYRVMHPIGKKISKKGKLWVEPTPEQKLASQNPDEIAEQAEEAETNRLFKGSKQMKLSESSPLVFCARIEPARKREQHTTRKIWLKVKVDALKLPKPVEERLISLVDRRFNPATRTLTLIASKMPNRDANVRHVKSVFQELLSEAWKSHPSYIDPTKVKEFFGSDPGNYMFFGRRKFELANDLSEQIAIIKRRQEEIDMESALLERRLAGEDSEEEEVSGEEQGMSEGDSGYDEFTTDGEEGVDPFREVAEEMEDSARAESAQESSIEVEPVPANNSTDQTSSTSQNSEETQK